MTRRTMLTASFGGCLARLGADRRSGTPEAWSRKDIQKLLSKSPWAREAVVEFAPRGGESGPPMSSPGGAEGGLGRGAGSGGGMGVPGGGTGPGGSMPEIHAVVRWESSLPLRLAMKQAAAPRTNHHVIALTGLPMIPLRAGHEPLIDLESRLRRMRESTKLERKGRVSIFPAGVQLRHAETAPELVFTFDASGQPIQPSDREVVFSTRMGPLRMMARFPLKEMTFRGKLEL